MIRLRYILRSMPHTSEILLIRSSLRPNIFLWTWNTGLTSISYEAVARHWMIRIKRPLVKEECLFALNLINLAHASLNSQSLKIKFRVFPVYSNFSVQKYQRLLSDIITSNDRKSLLKTMIRFSSTVLPHYFQCDSLKVGLARFDRFPRWFLCSFVILDSS